MLTYIHTKKMKKGIIVATVLVFGFVHNVFSQQDPNFTLYNFNMNIINPATAGIGEMETLSFGYRSQWIGLSDAPNTKVFNLTKPLKKGLFSGLSRLLQRFHLPLPLSFFPSSLQTRQTLGLAVDYSAARQLQSQ